jgi:hypothetical protein
LGKFILSDGPPHLVGILNLIWVVVGEVRRCLGRLSGGHILLLLSQKGDSLVERFRSFAPAVVILIKANVGLCDVHWDLIQVLHFSIFGGLVVLEVLVEIYSSLGFLRKQVTLPTVYLRSVFLADGGLLLSPAQFQHIFTNFDWH